MKKTFLFMVLAATVLTAFTGCDKEDDYIAQQLRAGDWQGYVGAYYSDRWGLSGTEYATVMRFTSRGNYYTSGRGEELDYDTRFRGFIRDYSNRRIQFDFDNVSYGDWSYYSNRLGSYGGFSNQKYFRSRTAPDAEPATDFIDRTDEARRNSGEPTAVSCASGSFARAISRFY